MIYRSPILSTRLCPQIVLKLFLPLYLFLLASAPQAVAQAPAPEDLLSAQEKAPTEEATTLATPKEVSLLFATGVKKHIYSIYGHVALRINDPATGEDIVYNWGIFDFDAPNFIGKFVKGNTTDYMLGVQNTAAFLDHYTSRGAPVYETVLSLTPSEIARLEELIAENLRAPYYLYNFVYDNCSTRPFALLERALEGEFIYPEMPLKSRREMVDAYASDRPWFTFGTDITLGLPADEQVGAEEQLFLPLYAYEIIQATRIVDTEGKDRAATTAVRHYDITPGSEQKDCAALPFFLLPFFVVLFLFIITVATSFYRGYNSRWFKIWGTFYFFILGLVGFLVGYLSFCSLHPLVYPNYNIFVFHPLYILLSIPSLWLARKPLWYAYHVASIVLQLTFVLGVGWFSSQQFHPATLLISLGSIAISLRYIMPILLPRHAQRA